MERTLVLSILSKNIYISKMMFFVFFLKKSVFLDTVDGYEISLFKASAQFSPLSPSFG